jgi:hypothetical protein
MHLWRVFQYTRDSELLARAEHRGSALSSKSRARDQAMGCI